MKFVDDDDDDDDVDLFRRFKFTPMFLCHLEPRPYMTFR